MWYACCLLFLRSPLLFAALLFLIVFIDSVHYRSLVGVVVLVSDVFYVVVVVVVVVLMH